MIHEMEVICNTLKLNTRLCINCFKDIDEATAQKRFTDSVNSMSYILIHMLDARYYMARIAGVHLTNPYKEQFKSVNKIEDYTTPPPIEEILEYWRELSELLCDALMNANESDLKKESRLKFPTENKTKLGGIIFLTQHDSFHLGQLALLRKQLGFDSMLYE